MWREKYFAGKITIGEKTKRSSFTKSNPRPPSSTCAIYINKIGMAGKQHFLNEDNNKNTGIHFGRACMHAWLSVLTKTGHSWFLDCWCWAFMTSSSRRRSHKTRKPALKQTPSDHNAFLHRTLIREVKQTSIKTHHNMWAIDVRIYMYTKYRSQNRSTPGSEPYFVLQALFLAAWNTLNALSKNC